MRRLMLALLVALMASPASAESDELKRCWSKAEDKVLSGSICRPYWEIVKDIYRECKPLQDATVKQMGKGHQSEVVVRLFRLQFFGDMVERIVSAQGVCEDYNLFTEGVWE